MPVYFKHTKGLLDKLLTAFLALLVLQQCLVPNWLITIESCWPDLINKLWWILSVQKRSCVHTPGMSYSLLACSFMVEMGNAILFWLISASCTVLQGKYYCKKEQEI